MLYYIPPWWPIVGAFASHARDRGSIPGRDRPIVKTGSDSSTAKRSAAGVRVSRVIFEDDQYKGLDRVTVDVAC